MILDRGADPFFGAGGVFFDEVLKFIDDEGGSDTAFLIGGEPFEAV